MDVKIFPMEFVKQRCRLCDDIKSNENVKIIDNVMKDIFSVLLIKLTFDTETKYVVCNDCSSKVLAASNFKSTCIYTDNAIIPFVDFENSTVVDLKEVYAREIGSNKIKSMSEDEKICRLCLQPISGEHWTQQDLPFDSIQIFIPEINFKLTSDPAFCSHCLDSLSVHSTFLKQCSDWQEESNRNENEASDTFLINSFVKTEEIAIKSEEIDELRDTPQSILHIKIENEDNFEDVKPTKTSDQSAVPKNKYTEYEYETTTPKQLAKPSEDQIHTCEQCDFKTNKIHRLQCHQLVHLDPSEVQVYRCASCTYEASFKGDLMRHLLRHKDPSEVRMLTCDMCEYKCQFRSRLRKHQLVHKDLSEVQTYSCDLCTFETKHKRYLQVHLLKHKDPSQVQMYKCTSCSYETKYKGYLKTHLLIHKDPSEVEMYKCDKCKYETKYRRDLMRHQFRHKDPSEEWM